MSNDLGSQTPPPSATVEDFGYRQELKRSLSLLDLLVYGLVFIVPGAPVAVFGFVFNASAGMVPLVYLVGLVAMMFTAASYITMSRAYPIAGSVYAYAGRAINETAGFLAGWVLLLDYLLGPTLILVLSAVAVHAMVPEVPREACIVAFVVMITVVSLFGIETTARTALVFLGLQILGLVVFMVAAFIALSHGVAGAHLSLKPLFNPDVMTPSLIFSALSLAVLSFLGFDAISTLAEEAKGGGAAIGRATFLSLILCTTIFIVLTYTASLFLLDRTSLASGEATDAAFYNIATIVGGDWLKAMLALPGVLFAGLPSALAAQVATARLMYSMSRDGKLPRALGHISEKRKVPDRAILFIAAVTLVLGLVAAEQIELLTSIVNFGALTGFLMLHVSVVAYMVRKGRIVSGFGNIVSAIVGFVIIAYVLFNLATMAKIVGLVWLAVGFAAIGFYKPPSNAA
jgi:amino acid transporter